MTTETRLRKLKRENSQLKRENQEVIFEDDGDGNWLVSYADLMTLLFGFFVMLMFLSIPDPGKMEKLKKATADTMGTKYERPYKQISDALNAKLKELNLSDQVTVTETLEGITLVSQGTLFFDSGTAVMRTEAANLMMAVADIIEQKARGFQINVEGHTDSNPIQSVYFPSNWELSSARAGSVVRLLEQKGIPKKKLRAQGLADTEPVTEDPAMFAKNRRIVIQIINKDLLKINAKSETFENLKFIK